MYESSQGIYFLSHIGKVLCIVGIVFAVLSYWLGFLSGWPWGVAVVSIILGILILVGTALLEVVQQSPFEEAKIA